jgi:hypothetical protein
MSEVTLQHASTQSLATALVISSLFTTLMRFPFKIGLYAWYNTLESLKRGLKDILRMSHKSYF